MSKFNIKKSSSATVNLAGGKAFSMNPEQELIHAVLTTFLEDKYYESGDDRIGRITNLIKLNKPEFVANLAAVARLEFNLRSVSHLLIGELAKVHKGDRLVKDLIVSATVRADDLTEIASCVGLPMPKQVKRGIRNALLKFDRYSLAKYKGEGKGLSMVDLFNLVHPKAQHASDEQKEAWSDLMTGKLTSFDTWETEIANAKDDAERTARWTDLVMTNKIGYMALLRNLNNLIKYKVSPETISHAASRIADLQEVKDSKQLPFRFSTAFDNVSGNREFSDAISQAMDHALSNVPHLDGKTLIALDASGSMSGMPMNVGSLFAATLVKANPNADLILYDTRVAKVNVSGRSPVMDIARELRSKAMGGGTETSLVFKYAAIEGKKYDRFIIISDNESWSEHYGNTSVQQEYNDYKKSTDTDPCVYAVDIQGYGTTDMAGGKVRHLVGWSDRLLDFIGAIERDETLVQYVRDYKLVK